MWLQLGLQRLKRPKKCLEASLSEFSGLNPLLWLQAQGCS